LPTRTATNTTVGPRARVVYYPTAGGEVPSTGNDRDVGYRLVDIFAAGGLWARGGSKARRTPPSVRSAATTAKTTPPTPPWAGTTAATCNVACWPPTPAKLMDIYFANKGNFSLIYTRNAYQQRVVSESGPPPPPD